MATKVFLDTNILQDFLDKRPGLESFLSILRTSPLDISIHISVLSLATLWYLNRKQPELWNKFYAIRSRFIILDVPPSEAWQALENPELSDLEDEFQCRAAFSAGCSYILTRDKVILAKHIRAVTPEEFIQVHRLHHH